MKKKEFVIFIIHESHLSMINCVPALKLCLIDSPKWDLLAFIVDFHHFIAIQLHSYALFQFYNLMLNLTIFTNQEHLYQMIYS